MSSMQEAISRVLSGQAAYDELPDVAQAAVRVAWEERMATMLHELDFTARLSAAAKPWAEADQNGHLVLRQGAPGAR